MPDREKVIKAFEECLCWSHDYCSECYQGGPGLGLVCRNNVCINVLAMLKEQEADIKNLNETIMNLLQKTTEMKMIYGDCEYVGELVRCKDCKHFTVTKFDADGHGDCHKDMGWKETTSDWFCADGERKEGR